MSDSTVPKYTTIFQPTGFQPTTYSSNSGYIDMSQSQTFSCIMNGSRADSYQLQIKSLDNAILYDSGNFTSVPNTNSGITYSGTWTTNSNQVIDDTNSQISYSGYGWQTYTNTSVGFYGNTVHQSSTANDDLVMNFSGTGINVYVTKGRDKGQFELYIDDVLKGTIDTYVNGTGANGNNFRQLAYTITNLDYGVHTIKIVVTGNKNGGSTGASIEFDYFQILNTNASKNSNKTNNYFTYTFNTNGINLYMDKTPDSGIAKITIDNVDIKTIDLYSIGYNLNQLVYSNSNLSSSSHTIKVTVTGNKNAQSKDTYLYFDSLTTVNKTALPTILYDKDTFSITIPANTIIQRGALKWQITFWNSNNNGENVSSSEIVFFNMSTPSVGFTVNNPITSKSNTFTSTYTQNENIDVQRWKMDLYSMNYHINEGFFGQNSSGTTLDENVFESIPNRYHVDEGEW
jgi:hypothetical protein